MRIDLEERILRNPAIGAVLVWRFSRDFCEVSVGPPNLAHLALALPLVLHRPTVRKIRRMNFGSGLLHAVASSIDITSDLQRRVEQAFPFVVQSLAVASASGLVEVRRGDGSILPQVIPIRRTGVGRLEPVSDKTSDMVNSARRLGVWFANQPLPEIASLLRVRF